MLRISSYGRQLFAGYNQISGYAWLSLTIVCLFKAVGFPLQVLGGLMVPLLHHSVAEGGLFGWSPGIVGIAISGFFLVSGLSAPICGFLGDRLGGRAILLATAILCCGGIVLLGFMTRPWQFFIIYSVILSLVFTLTVVPLSGLVAPWFQQRLGLAIGLTWAAGSVGAAVLLPALAFLLDIWGWTTSFLVFGIIGGVFLLVLAALFREPPGMRRRAPVVGDEAWIEERLALVRERLIRDQIRRTKAFWNLPVIHGLGCGGHGIILVFMVDFAVHDGFSPVTGAMALTISQFVSIPSRLLAPILAERIDGRIVMSGVLALQGLSALALMVSHDLWALYLSAAVFGLAYGGESSVYPVVNRCYFGYRPLSGTYGGQMLGALLGQSVAVAVAGLLIDRFEHVPAFLLAVALNFTGFGLVWTMESTRRELVSEDGAEALLSRQAGN